MGRRGDAVDCLIAGMRGDADAAQRAAARPEQIGVRSQANVVSALTRPGRVLAALGASRHAEAFQIAERLFDPADPAYHPVMRCWLIGDLAETAANIGRPAVARLSYYPEGLNDSHMHIICGATGKGAAGGE